MAEPRWPQKKLEKLENFQASSQVFRNRSAGFIFAPHFGCAPDADLLPGEKLRLSGYLRCTGVIRLFWTPRTCAPPMHLHVS